VEISVTESHQVALGACAEGLLASAFLTFCPWEQRGAAACLSKEWRVTLGLPPVAYLGRGGASCRGGGYWRFLCDRLEEEHQIYVPIGGSGAPARGIADSWKELFLELIPLARVNVPANPASNLTPFDDRAEEEPAEVFNIGVVTRFKPAPAASEEGQAVVLPLHQKTQLIRQELGCSSKEALAMIMRERRSGLRPRSASEPTAGNCTFQACVYPDPENNAVATATQRVGGRDRGDGKDDGVLSGILAVREGPASVLTVTRQSGLRDFSFDRVFGEAAPQDEIYELSARRLVMEFLNGRSASIICYGQTGSGKTFTMFSPPANDSCPEMGVDGAGASGARGLVPRACEEVLRTIRQWRDRGFQARLAVSYVELFGSEVSDLLHEGRIVGQGRQSRHGAVRETDRVSHRYVLDRDTEYPVESWEEVDRLLRVGDAAKRQAAASITERSTRAHAIFVLSLSKGGRGSRCSRFYFADLGGSEQLSKNRASEGSRAPVTLVGGVEQSRLTWQEYYQHRQRLQETLQINKGLSSLRRVIEALHERSRLSKEGVPSQQLPYVPYQDSKLTMLLQEALGGSARTLVMATASMDPGSADESLQTLRFAEICSKVQKRTSAPMPASAPSWSLLDCFRASRRRCISEVVQMSVPIDAEADRKRCMADYILLRLRSTRRRTEESTMLQALDRWRSSQRETVKEVVSAQEQCTDIQASCPE